MDKSGGGIKDGHGEVGLYPMRQNKAGFNFIIFEVHF